MPQINPADDPVRIGGFLDHYFILKELGAGKMCTVHLAFDVRTKNLAAIKRLHAHHDSVDSFQKRLLREAQILEQFQHPHLLGALENRVEAEGGYLAVEYLRGVPLDARMRSEGGSLFVSEAFRYLGELASALHFAHQRGIVHRDVRPDNIMIDHAGTARLFDFGIAYADDQIVQTQIGDISLMGEFASPEQMMGKPLNAVSDLFSLGAVIYLCLTGRKVNTARTVEELFTQINQPVTPPSQVDEDVPALLDPVICKLLAKDPTQRYQSAKELLIDVGKLYATEVEEEKQALFGRVEDARLAWARRAFEQKDYGRVIDLAADLEDLSAAKKAAFYRLAALAHTAENRKDLALKAYEKAAFTQPGDVNYCLDFVLELVRQDEVVRAMKVLGEAEFKAVADKGLADGLQGLLGEWNHPQVTAIREKAERGSGGGFLGALGSLFGRGGRR